MEEAIISMLVLNHFFSYHHMMFSYDHILRKDT